MVIADATANTTEGNSRASRESGLLCSHSHGEHIASAIRALAYSSSVIELEELFLYLLSLKPVFEDSQSVFKDSNLMCYLCQCPVWLEQTFREGRAHSVLFSYNRIQGGVYDQRS